MSGNLPTGKAELRQALKAGLHQFTAIAVFSFFVNLLMLTGPLFMLQIYDRVLSSRSEATLIALTVLVVGLYGMMAVLDYLRGRVASRLGAQFQARFDLRLFKGVLNHWRVSTRGVSAVSGLRDLEAVQRFLSSPAVFAFFDMPWTPIYILLIWSFHPLLGWFSLAGGVLLIILTMLNQSSTRKLEAEANEASRESDRFSGSITREADVVIALGMQSSAGARWRALRNRALTAQMAFSDRTGIFGALTKSLRMFLQSAVLALGAWLVLRGELSAGAMIAASILLGRALAPVEQAIGQTQLVQRAWQGWLELRKLLPELPAETSMTRLPRPQANVEAENIIVTAPGLKRALIKGVSFEVKPGEVLAVLGSTGSCKTTLARALTGIWPTVGGSLRLGGATLDQYDDDSLGRYIGYLPQDVRLFEGTLAENIARMDENPVDALVIEAAKRADIHDIILRQEKGYDTRTGPESTILSGGQRQRLGLARALYRDPELLILDEPNANLDAEGSVALNRVIREMKRAGKAVIIMAHRPSAIEEADLALILENGSRVAFGPVEEVLRKHVANHKQIAMRTGT